MCLHLCVYDETKLEGMLVFKYVSNLEMYEMAVHVATSA